MNTINLQIVQNIPWLRKPTQDRTEDYRPHKNKTLSSSLEDVTEQRILLCDWNHLRLLKLDLVETSSKQVTKVTNDVRKNLWNWTTTYDLCMKENRGKLDYQEDEIVYEGEK